MLFEQIFGGCVLPLSVSSVRRFELKNAPVSASEQELEDMAFARAQRKLNAFLPHNAIVLSKRSGTEVLQDGSVRVSITVNTEEEIGQSGDL